MVEKNKTEKFKKIARIDIKNKGGFTNNIQVLESDDPHLITSRQNWFKDEFGEGIIIESDKGNLNLKIKCIKDGELNIILRSKDVRDKDNIRIPLVVKYNSLNVDSTEIFSEKKLISHDEPFIFKKNVKNNDIVSITLNWTSYCPNTQGDIFIRLAGGLGNQLFQYAFARSLAYDLNKKLYIDISYFNFDINTYHVVYGLHPYNIKGIVGNYYFNGHNKSFYDELTFYDRGGPLTYGGFYYRNRFSENIDKINFPAYFTGYYSNGFTSDDKRVMSEKFFVHNKEIIHEDLKYLLDLSDEYINIAKDIENHESVAIHIRRGDYTDISNFGTCSVEYYEKAIEKIASQLKNPKFYIFTEDHEWFNENINIKYPHRHIVFKEKNDSIGRGYGQLLKIMSLCKHFIIGNSTFSWWGAWLSEYKNKKIIAPKPWFQSREILEVESIDGIKPIHITNNYKKIFDKSNICLFKLNHKNDFKNIKNLNISKNNKFIKVTTLKNNSELTLNTEHEVISDGIIIKFSLNSNKPNFLNIIYQTENNENLNKRDVKLWYYQNETFEHYMILPKGVNFKRIKIKPANVKDISLKIYDLEIRKLDPDFETH